MEQPCSQAFWKATGHLLWYFRRSDGVVGVLIQIWKKVTINKPEKELSFTKKACFYVRWYGQKHLGGALKKKHISQQSVFIHILFLFCFSLRVWP